MASDTPSNGSPLVRKLESIYPLTSEERQALVDLPVQVRELRADQDVVREGDRPSRSCVLLEGFAFRYKIVGEDGRRQIMAFHVAGDMPDLMSLHLPVMDNSVCTLIASKLAFIEHSHLRQLIRRHPRIGDALWRDTLIDSAIFREWLVGMGRRDAYTRIAHVLCETFVRMQAVGLADGFSIPLPITQGTISDALGLSTVHVNRVVQALRAAGLIAWNRTVLTIKDWDGLQKAGEFDPIYLHLREHSPAA
jgi:CRP-like cAMP-binding protein